MMESAVKIGGVFRDGYVPGEVRYTDKIDERLAGYRYFIAKERRFASRDGRGLTLQEIRRLHYYGTNAGFSRQQIRQAMTGTA